MVNKERVREQAGIDEDAAGDMTPMIDVTFQLIIFFMLQKFKTLEGKLSAFLPKDVGVNTTSAKPMVKLDVHVYLVKKGTFTKKGNRKVWTGRKIKWKIQDRYYYNKGDFINGLKQFAKTLRDPDNPDKPVPVTLHAHPGVFYGEVTKTVDDVLYSGFEKVTFAGGYAK